MANGDLALERRFPGLAGRLPRLQLTVLPTPVHRLARLEPLAGPGSLWIKRDDRSGVLYGGNKPRKLEFVLGAAVRRGRRSVMTFGGLGTNHGLATAICAREVGLRTLLILVPQPVTEHVRRNLLLHHAFGAEMHFAGSVPHAAATAIALFARGAIRRDWPELIPAGGTSTLGTIGYVNAALELAEQIGAGALPEPDWIFAPLGSGGTVAGLVAGLKLAGLRSRVAAVLVTDILPPSAARLARLARGSLRRLRRLDRAVPAATIGRADFHVLTGYLGAGYGAPSVAALEAQRTMEELEDVHLETTYSAKCLAALLAVAGTEPYRGGTLLFWNTYSSVDPVATLDALPDPHELPPAFHRFFAE